MGRNKAFERGEMLCVESQPVQRVALLTTGLVKTTQIGASGSEVILRISGPGHVIGVASLLATGRHDRTVQSFRDCRVLLWDARTFRDILNRHPVLQQNMVRVLGAHLQDLEERFHEVATERVAPRVARQLVRLHQQMERLAGDGATLALSREDLAQMTGTTPFTVSRLLSAWEEHGWVRCGREAIGVCDVPALLAIDN
jgi:CRP-like cAMP-binding protein